MSQLVAAIGSPVLPITLGGMIGPTRLVTAPSGSGEPEDPNPVDKTYKDAGYHRTIAKTAGFRGPIIRKDADT